MFSSPAIRVFNAENADSRIQRKPGNNILSRKPFLDKTVNSKTPDANKLQKPTLQLKQDLSLPTPVKSPKKADLRCDEFIFSYKEVKDNYDDIYPSSKRLQKQDMIKILHNYCNYELTPPPSPQRLECDDEMEFSSAIDPIFLDLPERDFSFATVDELEIDYVEVPPLDFDAFD